MNVDDLLSEWRMTCRESLRIESTESASRWRVEVPATTPDGDPLEIVLERSVGGRWGLLDLEQSVGRLFAAGVAWEDSSTKERIEAALREYGAKLEGRQVVLPLESRPTLEDVVRFVQAVTLSSVPEYDREPEARGENYTTIVRQGLERVAPQRFMVSEGRVVAEERYGGLDAAGDYWADAGLFDRDGSGRLRAVLFAARPSSAPYAALRAGWWSGEFRGGGMLSDPTVPSIGVVEREDGGTKAERLLQPHVTVLARWSSPEDDPKLDEALERLQLA